MTHVRNGFAARRQRDREAEDKPYGERQCGFTDAGGNTWWVSTYLGDRSASADAV